MIFVDLRQARKSIMIILSLMFLIICFVISYRLIKINTYSDIDYVQYRDYIGLGGKFMYKLPLEWKTMEQKFGSDEIIYHNDFVSKDKSIHGYVQVWNLNMPLIDFIKQGKKNAVGFVLFKNYVIEEVKINDKEGYILNYTRAESNNKYIKAFEVFVLDKGNTFYRFAFYMDEQKWKDEYRNMFLNIAAAAQMK